MTNYITGFLRSVGFGGAKEKTPKESRFAVLDSYGFFDVKQFFHTITELKAKQDIYYTPKDGFKTSPTSSNVGLLKDPAGQAFEEILKKAAKLSEGFDKGISSFLETKRLNLRKMNSSEIESDIKKLTQMLKEIAELKNEISGCKSVGMIFLRSILENQNKKTQGDAISNQTENILKQAESAQKKIESLIRLYLLRKEQLSSPSHTNPKQGDQKIQEFQQKGKSLLEERQKTSKGSYILSDTGEAKLFEKMKEKYLAPMQNFQSEIIKLKKDLIKMNNLGNNLISGNFDLIAARANKISPDILNCLKVLPGLFEKMKELIKDLKNEDGITSRVRENLEFLFLDIVSEYNEIVEQEEEFSMFASLVEGEIARKKLQIQFKEKEKNAQGLSSFDKMKISTQIRDLEGANKELLKIVEINKKLYELNPTHLNIVNLIVSKENALEKKEISTKEYEKTFSKFKKISEDAQLMHNSFLKLNQTELLSMDRNDLSSQINKLNKIKNEFKQEIENFKDYKGVGKTFIQSKIHEIEKQMEKMSRVLKIYENHQKYFPEKIGSVKDKKWENYHKGLDEQDLIEQQPIMNSPTLQRLDNSLLKEINKTYLTPLDNFKSDLVKIKNLFVNLDLSKRLVRDGEESISKNKELIKQQDLKLVEKVVSGYEKMKVLINELQREEALTTSSRSAVRTLLFEVEKELGELAQQYQAFFPGLKLLEESKNLKGASLIIQQLGEKMLELYPKIETVNDMHKDFKKVVESTTKELYKETLDLKNFNSMLEKTSKLAEKSGSMVQKYFVDRKKAPLHLMSGKEISTKIQTVKKELKEIEKELELLKSALGKYQRFAKKHIVEDFNKIIENVEKNRKVLSLYESSQKENGGKNNKLDKKDLESLQIQLKNIDRSNAKKVKKSPEMTTLEKTTFAQVKDEYDSNQNKKEIVKNKANIVENYLLPITSFKEQIRETTKMFKGVDIEETIVNKGLNESLEKLKFLNEEIHAEDKSLDLIREEERIEFIRDTVDSIDEIVEKIQKLATEDKIDRSEKIAIKEMLFKILKDYSDLSEQIQKIHPSLSLLESEMKLQDKKNKTASSFIELNNKFNEKQEALEKTILKTIYTLYKEEIDEKDREQGYVKNILDVY